MASPCRRSLLQLRQVPVALSHGKTGDGHFLPARCSSLPARSTRNRQKTVTDAFGAGPRPLIALTGATGFIGQYLLQRAAQARLSPAGAAAPPERGAARIRERGDRRSRAAAEHVGGARRRRCRDPLGRHRARDVRRAGGRLSRCSTPRPRSGSRRRRSAPVCGASCSCRRSARNAAPVEDVVQTESIEPQPIDAYGRSKLAAEQGLATLDLDWVALRPVLVYGPGVKGNMAALVRLARSRLAAAARRPDARGARCSRSTISSQAIDCVLTAPAPLRRPLIVADPEPLTLPEMVAAMRRASAAGRGSCRCRRRCSATACRLAGREEAYRRLAGSLVADPAALRRLGWRPSVTTRKAWRRSCA